MIKAELLHNPYLLITKVKFNEQDPKINSQIEKYEGQPLNEWVDEVPGIFYDEMNGYDFDFYFTGTESDFNSVKTAYEAVGVSSELVRLFHKNVIEDPETKSSEIDKLLNWLKNHPNRKFDYDKFQNSNDELFDVSYPFIIVGEKIPENLGMSISPETVENVTELVNTNLSSTPILFIVEEQRRSQFRDDMTLILNRTDVQQKQLFFMIDPSMNMEQVTRVISDLGVTSPQIVNRYDAEEILSYVRNYPLTEYVRNVIHVFSDVTEQISAVLETENKESQITNADIRQEIDGLDQELALLKEADEFFVQRDNYAAPHAFIESRQILEEQLVKWKNKKTKAVGQTESQIAASDYSKYIDEAMKGFFDSVLSAYQAAGQDIENDFSVIYTHTEIDVHYRPGGIALRQDNNMTNPEITSVLLEMQEVTFEDVKNDFFGLFKKSSDEPVEQIRVVTCYFDQWRNKAAEILLPIADNFINGCYASLMAYYNAMAENYHKHLMEIIGEKTNEKEKVSAQLSDDEKHLQEDNDWLAEVKEQLQKIERG